MIQPNCTLLFQGDSITDAGRNREIKEPNTLYGLGYGYCHDASSHLLKAHTQDNLKIYNRGISGNRIVDLYARWKPDGLNLKPDIISILIGVNDQGEEIKRQNGVELLRFEKCYRMLLEWTLEVLPHVKLILCEPFLLLTGEIDESWIPEMKQRQKIVAGLAEEFKVPFVAFQTAFDDALKDAPASYWSEDGIHPSVAGHKLMAETWLKTVAK